METTKKQKQQQYQDKEQRQKQIFFQQVYRSCQNTFSNKEFQFFVKCIIPHRIMVNKSSGADIKPSVIDQKYQQKQDYLNSITPNILTMPRKFNFYEEKNIDQMMIEKKNKRILTTPTQKIKRQLKFQHSQQFSLFKKMKLDSQKLKTGSNNWQIKNKKLNQRKLYCPQSLFYSSNNIQMSHKQFQDQKSLKRCNTQRKFRNYGQRQRKSTEKINHELIPQRFIQLLRICNKKIPFSRTLRSDYSKSMR